MANILVIDDDKDILRLLEFALKRAGHTVEMAYDGEQGLGQAEIRNPDLIVCDVMMPKMTGYEFCRQARSKPTLKQTPIIVFSARFQPVDKQTALDAGATEYLSKSTSPDILINRIAELLPKSQPSAARGMFALFSLRGGVGATSLSVNLAISLARTQKTKTTLIDLVPTGGHGALMFGLRPTSSVVKLLNAGPSDFSTQAIQPHLMQHQSDVQLLASTPMFDQDLSPSDNRLLELLSKIKSDYPITILDVPRILEPHFSPLLQLVDRVVLVLSPDMPSIQSAAIALQGLNKLGMNSDKISLVVNQVNQYNALPIDTIQKAIRRPITAVIPFDSNMGKAVNQGKPLLLSNAQSPAIEAINTLASTIIA